MPIAVDPRERFTYILKRDRAPEIPPEQRTVFYLRPLTVLEQHRLFDDFERVGTMRVRRELGSSMLASLRRGLVGWSRFPDAQGREVPFEANERGEVSDASLARLRLEDRLELADAIENEVAVNEEDLGKSAPPSTSLSAT